MMNYHEYKMHEMLKRMDKDTKMSAEDAKRFLDHWGTTCFICNTKGVSRDSMHLGYSVVPLEKAPKHAGDEPQYTHYYMYCDCCKSEGTVV